jgi:Leucine rich repeat variant
MDKTDRDNRTAAHSQTTSSEQLRELYHCEPTVHSSLANNPNTPADVLQALAHSNDEGTRYFVARNPSTPADTLEMLARDNAQFCGSYIRGNVGLNPNAPSGLLEQLAQDTAMFAWTRLKTQTCQLRF